MGWRADIYNSRKPLVGFAAIGAGISMYFAQMPAIKANVGASDAAYGAIGLIGAFGAIMAMWLAPRVVQRGGEWAVPFGIAALCVGMFVAAGAQGVVVLTLGLVIAFAGAGVVDVLSSAHVSEVEAQTGRPLMNLNHAFYSFVYAAGALITGVLREVGIGPMGVATMLGLILTVLLVLSRESAGAAVDREGATSGPMPVGFVTLGGVVVMVAFLAEAASEGWSALHLERTLGGTPGEGALGPAALGLTMGIGRLSGHVVSRYLRDTHLMGVACLMSACGLCLAGVADTVAMALSGFALAGLGISVVGPLGLALVGRLVPAGLRLAAISRASAIGYGAFFVGPALMGFISEGFGLRAAFIAMGCVLVVTAVVLVPLLTRMANARGADPGSSPGPLKTPLSLPSDR